MYWPSPDDLPAQDAPPLAWARFYLSMGWLPLPTRCDEDIEAFAGVLFRERVTKARDRGEPVDEERFAADAREEAEATRKGPMIKWATRTTVTHDDLEGWWGRRAGDRGPKRGIWVPMGRLRDGAPKRALGVLAVDVDPRTGGDPDAWASEEGPIARTPSGGIHVLYLPDPEIRCSVGEVAPGVDVRASGGGIVVPSGLSSPGRSWCRWEPPVASPPVLREAREKRSERREVRQAAPGGGVSGTVGSNRAAWTVAEILAAPAPDGTRNAHAAAIVGILARPGAIPEDALEAALALLAEVGVGDEDGGDGLERWRSLLTRGPRDVEVAVEFVRAWNVARCDPQWSDSKAEKTARNFWKTADRREGGHAGAEDLGIGAPLSAMPIPARAAAAESARLAEREPGDDDVDDGSTPVAAGTEGQGAGEVGAVRATAAPTSQAGVGQAGAAPTAEVVTRKQRVEVLPERFAVPLDIAYSADDFAADLAVDPITLALLPPWLTWDERPDPQAPWGYGIGPWLEASLAGGLTRGSFIAMGASTAKGGKTSLLQQIGDGLMFRSAETVRRILAGQDDDREILLTFWLTEMRKHRDLSHRMVGRYLGIDTSMWKRGTRAPLAPGIQRLALDFGVDPAAVVRAAQEKVRRHSAPGTLLNLARHLTINLDPSELPQKRGGRMAEDPQLGLRLMDSARQAVERRVAEVAAWLRIPATRILPTLILDPVHRFIDASGGEGERVAINQVIGAARRLAHNAGWIVAATADTTKGAASDARTIEGDPTNVAAQAFAGTQNLAHEPDTVIVIHAEQVDPPEDGSPRIVEVPVKVRVCLCRNASAGPALPFLWHPHLGRYLPIDPAAKPSNQPTKINAAPAVTRRGRPKKH